MALVTKAVSHPAPAAPGRAPKRTRGPRFDPKGKTAVILVSGFNGTGLHTLLNVKRLFGDAFRNWFFMQAGIVDADRFKGAEAIEKLRAHVDSELARGIFEKNPNCVFFGGQIVFPEETFLSKLLFNHTTFATQRRLHQLGIPFLIMPIRVR